MNNINDTIGKVDLTALKRSFIDSLSNKEFKDYVDSLKIDYDILMKYTSSLEDSFCEQKKCLKCKSLTMCKNDVAGYKYSPIYDGKVVNFSYVIFVILFDSSLTIFNLYGSINLSNKYLIHIHFSIFFVCK